MSQLQSGVGVFISYSHDDRFVAETLAQRLREIGYHPWIDFSGLVGGVEWKKSIECALKQSAAFVLLMTPEALKSEWVNHEINMALEYDSPLIPLMIRTCELPARLTAFQYVDFRHEMDNAFRDLQRALLSAVLRRNAQSQSLSPPASASRPEQVSINVTIEGDVDGQLSVAGLDLKKVVAEPVENRASYTPTSKPLALVVEDMKGTQELLRDLLDGMGFEVHVAGTRNEATALLRDNEEKYAFVTLDMQLGPDDVQGQEGVYLLDLLKRYQPEVPIVIISSLPWDKNQAVDFLMEHGVKYMFDKPFDQQKLREIVHKYVESRN